MVVPSLSAQEQELYQGFEDNANDTWNYTVNPPTYQVGDDIWAVSGTDAQLNPASGQQFWFARDLDNPNGGNGDFHTMDFATVDVQNFNVNAITFKYNVEGFEPDDSIGYIIETEPGTDFDMANYVDLSRNTEGGWVTEFINLPVGITTVRFRLMVKQDGTDDWAGFDDISIFSSVDDVLPPVIVGAELRDENTVRITYSEPMEMSSVMDPMSYTSSLTISDIEYTEPGGSAFPYVDITFDSSFSDGQANTITPGFVTDAAFNPLIENFTFEWIYNNLTPNLVITEILYNPPGQDILEFIEIYNADSEAVPVGGLTVSSEFSFAFPELTLAPGEIVLLALNEVEAEAFFGLDFYDWGFQDITNGDEVILITNFEGALIDSVNYLDEAPWPAITSAGGPSIELTDPTLDNNDGANWIATTEVFNGTDILATPGVYMAANQPVVSFEAADVIVSEGDGTVSFNLGITNANTLPTTATIGVVSASTAVVGEDYNLLTTTVNFPANSTDPQTVEVELLDNNTLGGRYLILQIESLTNAEAGSDTELIVLIQDNDDSAPVAQSNPAAQLVHQGSFALPDGAAAEIIAYDSGSQRVFTTNSEFNELQILDFSMPNGLTAVSAIDLSPYGGGVNSVAVYEGLVAVAMEAETVTDDGAVVFFDTDGVFINQVTVGALPDMLTFTPDGSRVLTANEGEPNDDYTVDPEGSISIIDVSGGAMMATVTTLGFEQFNPDSALLTMQGVRVFGPNATVAQDLEPEFITISDDGSTAYVFCQENNTMVTVDINAASITGLLPLGFKDWTQEGVTFDASNRTDGIFFANWPVQGMYQPDGAEYFSVGGQGYLVTANEGDSRDYDGYSEEFRVGDDEIVLDPTAFPGAEYLKNNALLGRLIVTNANGDTDGDGDFDELYALGGRSFTIWNAATGEMVFDSGNDLEQITAADPVFGAIFNATDDENVFKNRSDDKGPEPEAVAVAEFNGTTYGFIALERIGGIMMYDFSDPAAPEFMQYINTRTVDQVGGDLAPEDLVFISPDQSADGKAYLLASYEVSGTVGVFELGGPSTVSFAESRSEVEEGSGILPVELAVTNADLGGRVTVTASVASTAEDGIDYTLTTTEFEFEADDAASQFLLIDILDNTDLSGKYLVLDIAPSSSVRIGENSRHIILISDNDDTAPVAAADPSLQLNHLGSYFTGGGEGTAEIVAFDGESQRLFLTNGENNTVDILDYSDPSNISFISSIDISAYGDGINSVAVQNGVVAAAIEAAGTDENGMVVFFDTDGTFLNAVTVGVLPDMVTFTPDGTKLLTANEGEPNDDYTIDPEGSISIIDISGGVGAATVTNLGFTDFNSQQADLVAQGVRVFGPGATLAQDLEPEYITVSDDNTTAYAACQENNALAVVDLTTSTITAILPLGTKDWTQEGVTFDASNRTDNIFFSNWPVQGFYHPDAIDYFTVGGQGYLITANEGDARDYDTYTEEFRVGDDEIVLDPTAFPDADVLKDNALLGRLRITNANGDTDGDGDLDELYAYGGRSFTIWNATTGAPIYDSGNDMEQITAADPVFGALFNTTNDENEFKNRSDDKGPEPEAVITAEIDGVTYAFIALERIGGVMVYDVTDPAAPVYLQYINTRTVDQLGGDLAPEGLAFIPADATTDGKPLLAVSYEVSGSVAMFELDLSCPIVDLPESITICEGENVTLEINDNYETIVWSDGQEGSTVTVENAGTLFVMATTAGGCMAMDSIEVVVNPAPVVMLSDQDQIEACEGETVTLDAGAGFDSYAWSNDATTQTIEVAMDDVYSVTVTDGNGCSGSGEIAVIFNEVPMVSFPQDTVLCTDEAPLVFNPGEGNQILIDGELLDEFTTEGLEVGVYSINAVVINEFDCEQTLTLNFEITVCDATRELLAQEQIKLFPNPTHGLATVELSQLKATDYELSIMSPIGQMINLRRVEAFRSDYTAQIDLSQMPAGIYLIRLSSAEGVLTRRLIVE
jgi:hypothetical protein